MDKQILYKFLPDRLCPKCGWWSFLRDIPTKYVYQMNAMSRTCPDCGYQWYERCKDGTEPTFEYIERP